MSTTSKAVQISRFGGPEVLQLVNRTYEQPKANEVLVKIKAFGVNPVEAYIRSGNHTIKPELPYTPGSDGAGIIEQVGDEVKKWKVSDRVYIAGSKTGTYAQHAICSEDSIHLLPENTSFHAGAALFVPYATAYAALFFHAQAKEGDTVLVHGASGAVGIAAVQLAKSRNIRVLGTSSTPEGMQLIERYGGEAFNHKEVDYQQKIVEATKGKGVDVILEMLANVNLANDLQVLIGKYGRIVIIGSRGRIEIDPRNTMTKNITVKGMNLFNSSPSQFLEIHSGLYEGLANGSLQPVIGTIYSLKDVPLSHDDVINHPTGAHGKIIVDTDL